MQNYCQNCGKPLPIEPVSFCPNCGAAINPQKERPSPKSENEFDKIVSNKDPFIAAILSFIFPGLGQVYNGEFNKGLLIQISFFASFFFSGFFSLIIIPIPIILLVIGVYDAYTEADKMRKGLTELKNPTFKETLTFILWPFVMIGALAFLAIMLIIFVIIAAALVSVPFVI